MPERQRDLIARLGLTVAALLPYWRFLTFSVVFVTDDYFASDIFNGELSGRVLIGRLIRQGHWPVWTSQICSGFPLVGSPADPIGLLSFALLPTAPALDLFVIVVLLVAAHGAYSLARRFNADHTAAVFAGVAFAGSGYFAAQLKHLSIVSTVAWLPVGLVLLDRAFAAASPAPSTPPRRALWLALFGLVFAEQVLCGFPQSAYICALVYGGFALFRAVEHRKVMGSSYAWIGWLAAAAIAVGLGAASGAVVMLPLAKLGAVSDRADVLGWDWATRLAYWPSNFWTFIVPYINGDISNNTYVGPVFFWEDYGYVGLFTFALAIYGAIRGRAHTAMKAMLVMTVLAYAFVLGRATPIYRLAFTLIPGLSMFRFPTRFLVVVELGLAMLAAIGLTHLLADLESRWRIRSIWTNAVALGLLAITVLDLSFHQPRQNPVVDASTWLTPPASVNLVRGDSAEPRTFTPRHRDMHRQTFQRAHGWSDVEPYFEARDLLEPNLGGGYWSLPSADCYVGISARWYIDVWGDHNREAALAPMLAALDFKAQELRVDPHFPAFLRTYGVTHVLSPFPQQGALLPFVGRAGSAYVYRVEDSPRVRFVPNASVLTDNRAAIAALRADDFDPAREIVLSDAPPSLARSGLAVAGGKASITREEMDTLDVQVTAPTDGFLLLADTLYPGWTVTIDGTAAPLYRANVSVRGVPVRSGTHTVRFQYEAPGLRLGAQISAVALALLLTWTATAYVRERSKLVSA